MRRRPVFDRPRSRLQEAWSIHGVYPQYAWTPDGKQLRRSGDAGKIWRVSVGLMARLEGTANARRDPVSCGACEQEVTEALRFPQQVFSPEFPVRMLTGVRTSPDGKTVAYARSARSG